MSKRQIVLATRNVVYTGELHHKLDLTHIDETIPNSKLKDNFPGLIIKLEKATFLLFSSGKFVITGCNTLNKAYYTLKKLITNLIKVQALDPDFWKTRDLR